MLCPRENIDKPLDELKNAKENSFETQKLFEELKTIVKQASKLDTQKENLKIILLDFILQKFKEKDFNKFNIKKNISILKDFTYYKSFIEYMNAIDITKQTKLDII